MLPDIQSRPPELVSPLSSSSSISSPVRHRRSSSNSSSSSSTPRSVIKTPSPLPTNHPTHISTSSEDEKPHVTPHKPSTILTKARKSLDKVRKSHTVRKSPYISDSDSDMETKDNKSKMKIDKVASEADKNKYKKRPSKKDLRSRSISSSSNSHSPERIIIEPSIKKGKPKKSRRTPPVKSSPILQKIRSNDEMPLNDKIVASTSLSNDSLSLHAPPPISPFAESPPSSPGSNSFDHSNRKVDIKSIKSMNEEDDEHFLHPSSPSRLYKRQRDTTPKRSENQKNSKGGHGANHIEHIGFKPDSKLSDKEDIENNLESNLDSLLNNDNYYPVQEHHKDFIPISKFKNTEYVEFLLLIQVSVSIS